MYFLSDGDYQWKTIMMFEDREQESKWIHEFYKEYGVLVNNLPQLRRDERPQVRDGSSCSRCSRRTATTSDRCYRLST